MKQKINLVLFLGIILALFVSRFFGNNFDHLRHLHPDERWLVMVVDKLHFFDNLNPDFFAYGSFPLYVLKAVAQLSDSSFLTHFDNYDGLLVLGRALSSLLDVSTAILVFFITKKITRNSTTALLAIFSYTLFFFPIQNSNFFIVDNFVNVLFSTSLLLLLNYVEKPNKLRLFSLAVIYGLLLASKITAVILLAPIVFFIFIPPIIEPFLQHKILTSIKLKMARLFGLFHTFIHHAPKRLNFNQIIFFKALFNTALFLTITIVTTCIAMPYTIINYSQFIKEITAQMTMNSDAYIFPYTLQYVDTTIYFYYLKQIAFWGIGPILSLFAILGLLKILFQVKTIWQKNGFISTVFQPLSIYLLVNLFYFLIIGRTAVKFMRYMLPLYPAIAVCVGIGLGAILTYRRIPMSFRRILISIILILAGFWTIAFLSIFSRSHSREVASQWMLKNIPPGSVIAEEHWDDRLPLFAGEKSSYIDLPLYELPDDAAKWKMISDRLDRADYIVMTSNRLYGSLPKLADCTRHKKCYPLTANYYQQLFAEKMNFIKVAEFTSRPSFLGIEIYDDNADESFTVYDHPKVIIFQRK